MPATALAIRTHAKDLAALTRKAMQLADGNTDKATDILHRSVMEGVEAPHIELISKLLLSACRAAVNGEHGMNRAVLLHNARHPHAPLSRATRRPILVRASNTELQEMIDSVLDLTLAGGVKLRRATRSDLFRSAEIDEKAGRTRIANAKWKRELGKQLRGGKSVEECGITALAVTKMVRASGGDLDAA